MEHDFTGWWAVGLNPTLKNSPPKGGRGPATSWDGFDETLAGGPVRKLTTDTIRITDSGIAVVEQHLIRFGPDRANELMIARLKAVATGRIPASPQDVNFYSHELREFVRYRKLGYSTGLPDTEKARINLWRQTHSATLGDYSLPLGRDDLLYHPEVLPFTLRD